MKSFIALTVAAFTLASCGGGSNPATSTTRDIGILPSGFAATLDDATDEVVLTIDGVEVARLVNTADFFGTGFTVYAEDDAVTLYAETISGDGAVFVVQSPAADLGLAGVQVTRLGETDLPSGGSATFSGAYAGFLVNTNLGPAGSIRGDVQLIADFASASISGDITNRSGGADDMLLTSAAITSAGAFSGTTTGGDFQGAGTSALDGSYTGLIVGATGNEVVGGLSITHIFGADTLTEIGGFVAAE